jgi:membrane fusion protein (multidrug efflux system)
MKKILIPIGATVCVLGVAAYVGYWALFWRQLERTDDAYIKVDSIVISPKISGYVAEVVVQDNQWVNAGQPLVRIEPGDYQAKVEQQEAALQSNEAALVTLTQEKAFQRSQITQAIATLNAANAQVAKAELDYLRFQQLIGKGFVSKAQVETSKLASEIASSGRDRTKAELAAAHDQLAILGAREAQLKADLRQSAAASKSVQLDLAHTTLVASSAGFVGNKTVVVGRYVKAGTQLMSIVPLDSVYVTANFKETQLRRIRPGQRATVTVDAFPGIELIGTVDSIAPAAGSEFSLLPPENAVGNFTRIVQRVPVKIIMAKSDGRARKLRPGMSVAVAVDTGADHAGTEVAQNGHSALAN